MMTVRAEHASRLGFRVTRTHAGLPRIVDSEGTVFVRATLGRPALCFVDGDGKKTYMQVVASERPLLPDLRKAR